ncbi:UNVERIFIED_CONTAM: hypothetical protein NCL1_02297 [Trichonephila clavipes]
MKLSHLIACSLFAGSLLFTTQAHNHKAKADIVDTAVAAGSFTTLVTAVQAAELVDTLKGEGPFTVFAPNDAAFAKIPAADLNALVADKAALTNVLTYHVVAGKVMAADVVNLTSAKTVQGQDLKIEVIDGSVFVNGAKVIATDIQTSNGVIHVLDSVLLLLMLPAALGKAAHIGDIVGLIHNRLADNAKVIATDIQTSNGVIHVLDSVLLLLMLPAALGKAAHIGDIVGLIHNRLADNAKVIATDIQTSNGVIHVLDSVLLLLMLPAALGKAAHIGDIVGLIHNRLADNAKVIATDIQTSNGVIHVLDSVVMPTK